MSIEIFRSSDFLVTEEAGVIRLEQLSAIGYGPAFKALLAALAGAAAALPLQTVLGPSSPLFLVLKCFSLAMGAIGLLGLLTTYWQRPRPFWIDPHRGIASLKGRQVGLGELRDLQLVEHALAGATFYGLMLNHGGKQVMLLSATSSDDLEPVFRVFRQWLQGGPEVSGENPQVDLSARVLKAFFPAFYLGTGSLCAGVGYLFAPNLALGHGCLGFLIWPMGLWVIALGLLEWLGYPATKKVMGLDFEIRDGQLVCSRGRGFTLLGMIWILSYLYFCRVTI